MSPQLLRIYDDRYTPPNLPRVPPECWKTQPSAHCCAFAARSSLQVRAAAPCCERTELCPCRYALMSLWEVAPLELLEPLPPSVAGACEVVFGAGAFEVVVTGFAVVVGLGGGVDVVVGAGGGAGLEVVVGRGLVEVEDVDVFARGVVLGVAVRVEVELLVRVVVASLRSMEVVLAAKGRREGDAFTVLREAEAITLAIGVLVTLAEVEDEVVLDEL